MEKVTTVIAGVGAGAGGGTKAGAGGITGIDGVATGRGIVVWTGSDEETKVD